MFEHIRKCMRRSFPMADDSLPCRLQGDIYDTVQTMNTSQSLHFTWILLVTETVRLFAYLCSDFRGRLWTPFSMVIMVCLLLLSGNLFCCRKLLKLKRTARTRSILKYHSYCFTMAFGLFCVALHYISLNHGVSAESLVMFYLYIAAGPIYSLPETLSAIAITALCSIPAFLYQNAPLSVYTSLFLYCFVSLFLCRMRCRIISTYLFRLRDARDEQVTLQHLADNDPLTQILNRNGYSLRLEELLPRAIRLGVPVAAIMIDIDYFKQYNDAFGHMAGDECLKKIARTLWSGIHRERDLICRFGGEEFQMFLYGISSSDAIKTAHRLRQAVASLKIPTANQSAGPYVSISLGVAGGVLTSMEDYHKLVKAADDELYYCKSHGKNMISFCESGISHCSGRAFGDKLEHAKLIYENSACPFAVVKAEETSQGKPQISLVYANHSCAQLECPGQREDGSRDFFNSHCCLEGSTASSCLRIAAQGGREILYDFSPETGRYLKVECFQFHQGYCGCIVEDVTDQHYFELFGSNDLGILNQITDGGILITAYDEDMPSVVYMNTILLKALDYFSFSEYRRLKGLEFSFLEDIYPQDVNRFQESLSMFTRDDSVRNCIVRIRRKKGRYLWFMLRGKLIIDQHQTPLVLFTAFDITKQLSHIGHEGL